jgi:nitrogenase molybdenum-iron protein alpha/beta subunit
MKNTNKLLITTLAGIALSLITVSAQTQVKGGERMLQLNSATTAAVTPGGYKPMSCAKCKDVSINAPDTTAKGASALMAHGVPTKTVVSHGCEGCASATATTGAGKHATTVATHKCTVGGSENMACCSTTKGTEATTKGPGN